MWVSQRLKTSALIKTLLKYVACCYLFIIVSSIGCKLFVYHIMSRVYLKDRHLKIDNTFYI